MYKIAKHLAWLSIWRRKTRSLMVIMMIALSLSWSAWTTRTL